ncbi:MAG: LysR family transcriptional regulator [Vulcanimicrobiota bacterium]
MIGHYELIDIRTFLTVVESGSISKAARQLDIAKSMVSQRMVRLETALGAELLRRSNKGVELTERGAQYYAQISDALLALDAAADSLAADFTKVSGTLKVSVPTSFTNAFLSPVLLDFLKKYSRIEMQIELHDHRVDLAAEGYDLGVRITSEPPQKTENWTEIGFSRRAVCCSPAYVKKFGVPRDRRELIAHLGIGYANLEGERLWSFVEKSGAEQLLPAGSRLTTNNGEMMRDAAVSGFGITVLPLFIVADDLRAGRLVRVLPNDEPRPDRIVLGCAPRRSRLLRVRLLAEHVEESLKRDPPWEQELPPPWRSEKENAAF